MPRLLIVYGSTEGQTRRIMDRVGELARAAGHQVTQVDAGALPPRLEPREYGAVIVAASVHQGRHQASVVDFVKEFRAALAAIPSAFVSVSLSAALDGEEHRDEARRYVAEFLEETGWTPGSTRTVAGALRFTEYDFFKRLVMRKISRTAGLETRGTEDVEYTDWSDVRRFVDEFLAWAERMPVPTPPLPAVR